MNNSKQKDKPQKQTQVLNEIQLERWVKRLTKHLNNLTTLSCLEYGDLLLKLQNSGIRGQQFEEIADRVVGLGRGKAYKIAATAKSQWVRKIAHRLIIKGEGWYVLYLVYRIEKENRHEEFETEFLGNKEYAELTQEQAEKFLKGASVSDEKDIQGEEPLSTTPVQTVVANLDSPSSARAAPRHSTEETASLSPQAEQLSADREEPPTRELAEFEFSVPVRTPQEREKLAADYYAFAEGLPTGATPNMNKVMKSILEKYPKCDTAQIGTTNIGQAA